METRKNLLNLIFKSLSGILDNYMHIFKDSLLFLSFFGAFHNQGSLSLPSTKFNKCGYG